MAEAFVNARRVAGVEAVSAGAVAGPVSSLAIKVMGEIGIDLTSAVSRTFDPLTQGGIDLVITDSPEAAENCPVLPGRPPRVDWNLPDPAALEGDETAALERYRQTRDTIRQLVNGLFDRGYLTALLAAKSGESLILDNISDGIIAHDLNRRIVFFNRAAEAITGQSRDEVLNRDCHDVFPGHFCGGKCLFCDQPPTDFSTREQQVELITKSGERRLVKMTLRGMPDAGGRMVGFLASFRDLTREHNLARRVGEIESFSGIIGRDEKMLEIFDLIRDLAATHVPVMIQGESGTGKELVAAAIHNEGSRANKLFVPVNCGALPESLLESELFGHVKGAFTGAIRDKKGRFELADGGTIFLDEIGDISPAMQVKLLRVLQEGTFERVGSEVTVKVDVRIISATHKDLAEEVAEGRFRDDLFYRLSVVPVWLPPLRDRRNDIPLLVNHVLARVLRESDRDEVIVSPEAMNLLMNYDWPGNVRELQNWIQFALVKCKKSVILPHHLPPPRGGMGRAVPAGRRRRKLDSESVRLVLSRTHGNKVEAARELGVSRATLYRFLEDRSEAKGESGGSKP